MLLPVGGPKGYGLSVIMDILCGVFAGGRFGRDLGEPGWSQFFQAIDIEAIMPLEQFTARIGLLLDQLKSCKPAPGSTGVFLPGEIEFNLKQQRLREGVPVPSVAVESINQLASELGMPDRLSND